jgi:hypothetical protein
MSSSARNGLPPFTLIGFATMIICHWGFVVPVSLSMCTTYQFASYFSSPQALIWSALHPYKRIAMSIPFGSQLATRIPSRLAFYETVYCLPVSTA